MEKKIKYINIRATEYMTDQIEKYKENFAKEYKIELTTTDVIGIALQKLLNDSM